MARRLVITPALAALLDRQDGVIAVEQLAAHGFDAGAIYRRIKSGQWCRLLPGVVVSANGEPTRRQRLVAAWLFGGEGAAIDGIDACAWHGLVPPRPFDAPVHVVAPWGAAGARTRDFVVVRRSLADIPVGGCGIVPYVDVPTALVVGARNLESSRDATGLLARGLQQGRVSVHELLVARERIGDKWCARLDAALRTVGVGLRSPAEKDHRDLVLTSRVLPEPLWNQWLDLGDGGYPICADALWEDAGMVNEVLGRRYHAWAQQFESTEARRARQVAAGLIVQGCTATQTRHDGKGVLHRLERTYVRNAGRGMPPGVRLIDPPAAIAC